MVFIMHLWLKKHKPHTLFNKLPEYFSGSIKCVRTLSSLVLCFVLLTLISHQALAESINITRKQASITPSGQLSISTRFETQLPEPLENILKQGVSIHFTLAYQLERPHFASYRFKLNQLLNNNPTINYRLSYHPLTNRYRVGMGTFSTEYHSLNAALKAIGSVVNWTVLPIDALNPNNPSEVKASVRLNLSTNKLPKPFQINTLNSKDWHLDSGWQPLMIQ